MKKYLFEDDKVTHVTNHSLPQTTLGGFLLYVMAFDLNLPIRAVQFLFAVIALGLNGYGT